MLREIEKRNGMTIWKSSDNRTGSINFYGVRSTEAANKPFDSTHATLTDARKELGWEKHYKAA